jgi:hypothetical protein
MAIKVQSTADIQFHGVKCIIYGGPGVGKTRSIATAPSPIIISAEEGLLSLMEVDIPYIEVKSLEDLNEAYNFLKKDAGQTYKTIGLDSLSEIAEVLIAQELPKHKDGRQAYAALAQAMIPMLKKFRDLKGVNTVFSCKKIDVKDEESGNVTTEMLLPGNVLGSQVPYIVDELFYMDIDRKGIPYLQVKPSRKVFAKDRSGALNPEGVFAKDKDSVPDMALLFKTISDKIEKERAKKSRPTI